MENRSAGMAEAFGLTAHEQLTCGCHVHVEVSSADEGVAVLDRAGPWLISSLTKGQPHEGAMSTKRL